MGEHNIVLKYRLIPTRTTGEEAFKKLRTDRQTDRQTARQNHSQTRQLTIRVGIAHEPTFFQYFHSVKYDTSLYICVLYCVSQCSTTCGDGIQIRRVVCQDDHGASSAECHLEDRPSNNQTCNMGFCPRWNHGDWTPVKFLSCFRIHCE